MKRAPDHRLNTMKKEAVGETRPGLGLSAKLLLAIVICIMIAEILIYAPSVANFRINWLKDRVATASVAAAAFTSDDLIADQTIQELLSLADARAIAVQGEGIRRLVTTENVTPSVDKRIELEEFSFFGAIADAFETLFATNNRVLLVAARIQMGKRRVEIVINEAPLRAAMLAYSRNILFLSLLISLVTAATVYAVLRWTFVRPLQDMGKAMARFAEAPDASQNLLKLSGRTDEIGEAERHLRAMQMQVTETMLQQKRLADLGLAVSKINHDLRNMLASAQLFSDHIGSLPDPTVQRLAPKLVQTLDRAIEYSQNVLSYGKTQERPPEKRRIKLHTLCNDVAEMLGLMRNSSLVDWENSVPVAMEINADPEHLMRVLTNLCRNAIQAMTPGSTTDNSLVRRLCVSATVDTEDTVEIQVADTGPGLPEKAKENMFKAFKGSVRAGGTGLGLVIAHELVTAHGGTIEPLDVPVGAAFLISLPAK